MSLKKSLLLIFCFLAMLVAAPANAALLITGVFDAPLPGGLPKGVELYASTAIADLTQYAIGAANNGGGTDGPESSAFPAGSLAAGDFYYLEHGDGAAFAQWFGFAPDYALVAGSGVSHNGDDALELFFDATSLFTGSEVVVDVFGDRDMDGSGTAWDSLDGWAYRKNTRGPDGSTFVVANWTYSGANAWDGDDGPLDDGTNALSSAVFPTGTYSEVPEPASLVLMLVGLAGMATRRRT